MVIREATLNDVPALAEIHVLAWRSAYAGHMPHAVLDDLSIEKRNSDWQRWLSEPGPGTTLVVETGDKLVAFCTYGPSRDDDAEGKNIGEILALNVHPEFWHCGYGKALCAAVLREAQRRQWEAVTLWMLKSNERAHLFYQALGFSLDGLERSDQGLVCVKLDEVRYGIRLRAE